MSPAVIWLAIVAVFGVVLGVGWGVNALETRCREASTRISEGQRQRRYATAERVRNEAFYGEWWDAS